MLFIGDSITQGWNSYYDTLSYAWRVSLYFNANSIINGIGGAFYEPQTFDVPDFDPDTVIVALGTNDFSKFKTTDEMLEEFAYLGKAKAEEVVIDNPAKIAARVGEVGLYPKHPEGKETFQPFWPDAADNIRNLCEEKIREHFGDNPPEIVVARKEKELGVVRRFILPSLAFCGSVFMVVASVFSHGMGCVWYLIVFAVIMAIGNLFYRKSTAA